jgi:hypothetical protein
MGISGLLPFVKRHVRRCNLQAFSGQTAVVDASCWLHKALSVSIKQCGNRQRYIVINFAILLKEMHQLSLLND